MRSKLRPRSLKPRSWRTTTSPTQPLWASPCKSTRALKRPDKSLTSHRQGNEWPRAYVVIQDAFKSKTTPQEIQDWLAKRVAKHKRLVGGVVFIDEVPKLASGKIQRKTMRDWAKRDAVELEEKGGVKAKL